MKREVTKKVITALRQVLDGKLFVSDEFARSMTEKMVEVQVVRSGSVIATLSDRELQVFEMLGAGLDSRDIADSLHIALKTVQTHCAYEGETRCQLLERVDARGRSLGRSRKADLTNGGRN